MRLVRISCRATSIFAWHLALLIPRFSLLPPPDTTVMSMTLVRTRVIELLDPMLSSLMDSILQLFGKD